MQAKPIARNSHGSCPRTARSDAGSGPAALFATVNPVMHAPLVDPSRVKESVIVDMKNGC